MSDYIYDYDYDYDYVYDCLWLWHVQYIQADQVPS